MNSDKSKKELILQQLKCLSARYDELLDNFSEMEYPVEEPTEHKRSWTTFFRKVCKKTLK
jgi:hypothetical protein